MRILNIDRRVPATTDDLHVPIVERVEYSIELESVGTVNQIFLGAMEYIRSRSITGEVRPAGNVLIVDVPRQDTGFVEDFIKEIYRV